MIRSLLALAALVLALAPLPAAAQPAFDDAPIFSLDHDGARRMFGLYQPSSYRRGGALIVALHGRFSSAKAFQAMSGLAAVADARGALVAYPQMDMPNAAERGAGPLAPLARDAGFAEAVIAALVEEYGVDPARVYLVGFDRGGAIAQQLSCASARPFAGVAVVSAPTWSYLGQNCTHAAPLLIMHGRRDTFAPVEGDAASADAPYRLSTADAIARWRGINGCGGDAAATRGPSVLYSACNGAPFAYVGVERGGHIWFGAEVGQRLNRFGVSAAATIDTFFFDRARFALPRVSSGDTARSYIAYAPPSYDPARPMPLVMVLHGRPSNALSMAAITEFNQTAEREGFIAVYPDGIGGEWNSVADQIGLQAEYPQDDVAFLTDLADDLRGEFNVDASRMYVAGFSNGGFMTLRMACQASDRFAAFASVGAALYYDLREICRRGDPAPVMIIHGTSDQSISFNGVVFRSNGEARQVSLSVPETVSYFARRNGCGEGARRTDFAQSAPETQVIRFESNGCANGDDVSFYMINGGGHVWPGVRGVLAEENFGPTNMDINASQAIWDFFKAHRLNE
jgi:polyhydroxybutyrate depolymerase